VIASRLERCTSGDDYLSAPYLDLSNMAEHQHSWALAEEAIEEYLLAPRHCLAHQKPDGGVLGYPAALLLLCTINALGTYLRNEDVTINGRNQTITAGEPFRVLNHPLLNQNLSDEQIKRIEKAFRNPLAHNALIASGVGLTPAEASSPFKFPNKEVWISVPTLYELVAHAWAHFDKTKIK
jgi:hypothetical protein